MFVQLCFKCMIIFMIFLWYLLISYTTWAVMSNPTMYSFRGTRKNDTRKNGPRKNGPREKWSPEKCPSIIVLRQKNARKFEWLFHFYQLILLHTQKDVGRLRHDPTYAPNCRTLKESRKVCCRVLGFHRLITSEHSTHTHTHTPRCSTLTPRLFLSEFWVCIRVLCLLSNFGFS